ncbi:MAG: hypothetical protein KJ621_19150 [Proteobacteria bacterium]|nr:hypothetical protein [Pseudomonadota bacterium]MBU1742028.1 hypothetical protein [Pseudomonadota bacterium]
MRRGTATLLFGCHQFILHPIYVARAWRRLYGRPDPGDLVAIIIHDWGYLGRRDVDGPEGLHHSWRMAVILDALELHRLARLVEGHSRAWCAAAGLERSKLYAADKLGTALMPSGLWARLARWTGEIEEYQARRGNNGSMRPDPEVWHGRIYRPAAIGAFIFG